MGRLKLIYNIVDTFLVGIWGLTAIEIITLLNANSFDWVDDSIKTALAFGGLVYLFGIKIPRDYRMGNLNRKNKELENEHLRLENEKLKDEQENN